MYTDSIVVKHVLSLSAMFLITQCTFAILPKGFQWKWTLQMIACFTLSADFPHLINNAVVYSRNLYMLGVRSAKLLCVMCEKMKNRNGLQTEHSSKLMACGEETGPWGRVRQSFGAMFFLCPRLSGMNHYFIIWFYKTVWEKTQPNMQLLVS